MSCVIELLFLLLAVLVTANSQLRNGFISDRSSPLNDQSPTAFLNYYSEMIDKSLKNDGSLSARSLFRGPGRFLFWRFRMTTVTKYTATSTSTSTTTCTLSTSSICSGRRRRSSLLEWSSENEDIAPTNVLKIEATPEADSESIRAEPCNSANHQHFIKSDDYHPSSQYSSDPYAIRSALLNFYDDDRYNYPSYYGGYQSLYDSPYRGLYHHYLPGYQQHPLGPYRTPEDDHQIAGFRRIFGLNNDRPFPRLFTTFTLTFTTTTGISTVFSRVTATSTPVCSTPGVLAQCPTG